MENLRTTPSVLSERLTWHYEQEVIAQTYKIIGAADILGNPVGLFSNLSSGVMDLFYEPIHGIMVSDNAQDIGLGFVKVWIDYIIKYQLYIGDCQFVKEDIIRCF